MKSFGVWYSLKKIKNNSTDSLHSNSKDDTDKKDVGESDCNSDNPRFNLHVNFWDLEDWENVNIENYPCLDIGLKIDQYALIDKMTFYCPFNVEDKDIEDLSEKMSTKNNACIIFNDDCEIHTKGNYTIVETSKEKQLVYPLDHVVKDTFEIKREDAGTYLIFNFGNFSEYINSNHRSEELKELESIYIRFRIKGSALKTNIYFDSEPLNKSFESAFSGTRMIDFKINEKRNIGERIRAEIIVNHEKLAKFTNVHFLVMEPSSYEVRTFENPKMSCRELEEKIWDDYLDEELNFSKRHILAYHWKEKEEKDSYSCLVKVNYSKARPGTILSYATSVVALGIISSAIVTVANIYWSNNAKAIMWCGVFGVCLLAFAIFLGKTSK